MRRFVIGFRAIGMLALAVVFASVTQAQQLLPLQFPDTDKTSITDCSAPSVLNLPGGQTVTFRGGQFIHYEDENFFGTIYATNSAAGCVNTGPDFDLQKPITQVTVTFSKEVTRANIRPYNLLGPPGMWDGPNPGLIVTFWGPSGNDLLAYGAGFPSHLMNPDPLPYPFPGVPTPAFTQVSFFTSDAPEPGKNFALVATNWYWGITSIEIPQGDPDFVRFDYSASSSGSDDGKILASAAASDLARPSQYQMATGGAPKVRITGALVDGVTKQPKAGTVYLRLDDPSDTADYRGGDAVAGDNDGPAAQLRVEATAGVAKVQTDAQGKFEITMTIQSHVAGDNYQFAGSTNASFTCPGGACPKSGIFTLWKRIYVDEQHMFKQGSFLNDIAGAGTTAIPIADPGPFQNLTSGAILELVHADSGIGEGFYFDFVTFRSLMQQVNGKWTIEIEPTWEFSRDYGARPTDHPSPLDNIRRDAVGIVAAGTYDANSAYIRSLFSSMSVEIAPSQQTVVEVPYVPQFTDTERIYFANRWLQDGTALNAFVRHANPNVLHRIAATQSPLAVIGTGTGAELGVTSVSGGSNHSFIFSARIDDLAGGRVVTPAGVAVGAEYTGADPVVINGEVTAHETVHFWVHGPSGHDGNGHCLQVSYRNPQLNCLMHEPYRGAGLADGVVDLHYMQHGADSEYMTVRRAADPVPQQ